LKLVSKLKSEADAYYGRGEGRCKLEVLRRTNDSFLPTGAAFYTVTLQILQSNNYNKI